MTMLWRDFRIAGRMLRKSPGFTAVAMLTLALGIGANLALFGILNEMLLRPKPVARPHELWAIVPADESGQQIGALVYRPYYDAIRQEGRLFEDVIGYANIRQKLRTEEGSDRVWAQLVAGDYFSFLGVAPVLGRGFLPEEKVQTGRSAVAVISHAFWRSYFGSMRDVLGKTVTLNDTPLEIVGVAPPGFVGLDYFGRPRMWIPANMETVLEKKSTVYEIVGRLTEPKLARTVEEHLTPIAAEVTRGLSESKFPDLSLKGTTPQFTRIQLEPIGRGLLGTSHMRPKIIRFLQFASVATVLLLLIACANVAGLFLARAMQRRKETATRIALGATRIDLMRQVICEGVLVAAGGTLGALLTFSWVSRTIMQFVSWWPGTPLRLVPDVRILLFAAGGVLAVGIGASILPALQASAFEPFTALKDGGGAGRKRLWLRHGLIVTQVAGSLVLLCGAMLCLRSMSKQLAVDLGYDHDRLITVPLDLERIGFTEDTFEPQLAEIIRRMASIPGVEQACVTPVHLMGGLMTHLDVSAYMGDGYRLEGYNFPNDETIELGFYPAVGADMFTAMGIPILRGRDFCQDDIDSGRNVAIVNESLVQKYWPNQDPLGKFIRRREVIGVVKDACFDEYDEQLEPTVFWITKKKELLHANLLIRTTGDARGMLTAVRAELGRIHPRLAQGKVCTVRDLIRDALAFQHTSMRILGALGVLALVLASVGTYGVMAYVVNSRTREIGIRVAVGATRGDVMHLILSTGLRLGLIAVAIGVPLALGGAIVLRHQIAGISPFDPVSFVAVTACVLATLIAACWLPARRAAKVDPMVALRHE
jgi:putative ABC transport system permease protein